MYRPFDEYIANWRDIVDFKVIHITNSAQIQQK
jgi:hypothetical protein